MQRDNNHILSLIRGKTSKHGIALKRLQLELPFQSRSKMPNSRGRSGSFALDLGNLLSSVFRFSRLTLINLFPAIFDHFRVPNYRPETARILATGRQ